MFVRTALLSLLLLLPIVSAAAAGVPECRDNRGSGLLTVQLLDVGQGEAILLTCPDGRAGLIDGGTFDELYPGAEAKFAAELALSLPPRAVFAFALNTHPHPDHLAGLLNIFGGRPAHPKISAFRIERYLDNGADDPDSDYDERLRDAVKSRGIPYDNLTTAPTSRLQLCPAAAGRPEISLELFAADESLRQQLGCPQQLNDCSIVSVLRHRGAAFYFLADATVAWEEAVLSTASGRQFLTRRPDDQIVVLKLGHHGSHSTGSKLLDLLQPDVALVSTGKPGVGTTEKYGYPATDVIARLSQYWAQHRKKYRSSNGLSSREPSNHLESRKISSCHKNSVGRCRWQQTALPAGLFSTAAHGTIRLAVVEDEAAGKTGLCIMRPVANAERRVQ